MDVTLTLPLPPSLTLTPSLNMAFQCDNFFQGLDGMPEHFEPEPVTVTVIDDWVVC